MTGPWNVAAFREAGMDVSVLSIPSAGSQAAQPFVGVQMFYQSAKSANPVAAKQFFNYLATPEGSGRDAEARWSRLRDARGRRQVG